ncbi:methyltransferase domain-containing protein [Bacillus sp. ISL-47]|uniref:class I SAM-dependent methyltransferase n=1 Tax=Bacillus sp. ISL-47 TaxID=2819130 RepID=UPI001BEB16B0|nr:class I SAM-dependent methyltransferase [Bacillus sp. ISL-47]MBT2686909.1 methyltransferase domain-containing protein [Bacillus sp. ISL-47]MBT2710448.1 methyltransferase domain-containing protein [Pseudomonas sp. ISL-84]
MRISTCRFCGGKLSISFANLGVTPLANSFLCPGDGSTNEQYYPLNAFVCNQCFLVQLEEIKSPEQIFRDYPYFSSYSNSWLNHSRSYVDMVADRFSLNESSQVVEIASNDGYLLQYFKNKMIPAFGIEPAENIAKIAINKGIETRVLYFSDAAAQKLLNEGIQSDLLIANNVLAHVPNLNSFINGLKILLSSKGVINLEFPHLLNLIKGCQFDTIYHEHYSYFSLLTVQSIFEAHRLKIFDVDQLPYHGGSLRIYVSHLEDETKEISDRVLKLINYEKECGLNQVETYLNFEERIKSIKQELRSKLFQLKSNGKTIAGFGAPAKGNTLLNYCRVGKEFLEYTVDETPYKLGLLLPGTHIPIYSVDKIRQTRPEYILILPWNWKHEVMEKLSYIREWGGKFIIPIPQVEIL